MTDPKPKKLSGLGPTAYGISKWSDPEPVQPVVDVKNDAEFFGGLGWTFTTSSTKQCQPATLDGISSSPSPTPPKEPQDVKTKARRKKDVKSNSALEEVVREIYAVRKDPSTSSGGIDSEIRQKDSRDGQEEYHYDEVKLVSSECDEQIILSRQMVGLSGKFSDIMEDEGFDGVITTTEGEDAMKLLQAWMSKDGTFEINIGIFPLLVNDSQQPTANVSYVWHILMKYRD
jgi:hypothetical protein